MRDRRQFLEEQFSAAGGAMPFSQFMAMALYDREYGYYTSGIRAVGGREADFATSATLTGALGAAIAAWVGHEIAHHGWKGSVDLIEVGGGDGSLAAAVLKSLGWWKRRRIRYHIVETEGMERQPIAGLSRFSVRWWDSIADVLEVAPRTLIISNELVDAFPVAWLRWNTALGKWEEIFVNYDPATGLWESFHDYEGVSSPPPSSAIHLAKPAEGQRIELHSSYGAWLSKWMPKWREGSMLTIDYGAPSAEEVYHRRPSGTLRAYHRHQRIAGGGIYARVGMQDLTCDVNFADLIAWGEALGLETVGLIPQGQFLARYGRGDDPMAGAEVGEAFQVLEQRRYLCVDSPSNAITVSA